MKVKYTEEQKIECLKLRSEGKSNKEIEKLTGVNTGSIRSWASAAGITLSRDQININLKHSDLNEKENAVLELIHSGIANRLVAKQASVSLSYVKRLKKKNNVTPTRDIINRNVQLGRNDYIEQARKRFSNLIDEKHGFIIGTYIDTLTVVTVKCELGHIWDMKPNDLLNNHQWCKECFILKMTGVESPIAQNWLKKRNFKDHLEWYRFVAAERGGKCLGPMSVVKNIEVEWECQFGHRWNALPGSVINCKSWCPRCHHNPSAPQIEVSEYMQLFSSGTVIVNDKTILTVLNMATPGYNRRLDIDIYDPTSKFAVEYNGLWAHCDKKVNDEAEEDRPGKDYIKSKTCHKLGLKYLMIYEDEWDSKKELVQAMIRDRMGKFNGIKLRHNKLQLVKLNSNKEWKSFFERNHLDGHVRAKFGYGLFLNEKMVMCATIRTDMHSGRPELARLATDFDYKIYMGASKLIKAIKKELNGQQIVTYSNNRLSSGDVYKQLGAVEITETTKPSYYYTDCRKTRVWRYRCRRNNNPEILAKYPTEKDQARAGIFSQKIFGDSRPLYRIEDAGHRKWLL